VVYGRKSSKIRKLNWVHAYFTRDKVSSASTARFPATYPLQNRWDQSVQFSKERYFGGRMYVDDSCHLLGGKLGDAKPLFEVGNF